MTHCIHICSSLVKIRLHPENKLPRWPGSDLKVCLALPPLIWWRRRLLYGSYQLLSHPNWSWVRLCWAVTICKWIMCQNSVSHRLPYKGPVVIICKINQSFGELLRIINRFYRFWKTWYEIVINIPSLFCWRFRQLRLVVWFQNQRLRWFWRHTWFLELPTIVLVKPWWLHIGPAVLSLTEQNIRE